MNIISSSTGSTKNRAVKRSPSKKFFINIIVMITNSNHSNAFTALSSSIKCFVFMLKGVCACVLNAQKTLC